MYATVQFYTNKHLNRGSLFKYVTGNLLNNLSAVRIKFFTGIFTI